MFEAGDVLVDVEDSATDADAGDVYMYASAHRQAQVAKALSECTVLTVEGDALARIVGTRRFAPQMADALALALLRAGGGGAAVVQKLRCALEQRLISGDGYASLLARSGQSAALYG